MAAGVCLALLAAAIPAAGQPYSRLSGLILDPSQAGVPGASVTVVNEDTGFRRAAHSQPDGSYAVAALEPGLYKATVRKEGFRTVVRFGIVLDLSRAARVDFTLPVGSMQETITVEGSSPLLGADDGSAGTTLPRAEAEHLPVNGRGLLGLLDLAPGALVTPATRGEAGQFTVNGQRPNTNYFTVDGVSGNTGVAAGGLPAQPTGGALPAMSAFGSLHGLMSLEALQELRIDTFALGTEFGRLPGANIVLTSRSGSNDFHASLVYAFRHEKLAANDWFANSYGDPRAPLRMNDFAAGTGGPVWRNHTFFYLSYEGMRLRQPFAWRTAVPAPALADSAPAWLRPLLVLFPAPNGPSLGPGLGLWAGRNQRPSQLDAFSARLDHALTARVTAFARYNEAPSSSAFGSTQVNRLDLKFRSLTAGFNFRPAPDLTLDLRLNASESRADSSWSQAAAPQDPCYLASVTEYVLRRSGVCDYLVRLSVSGLGQIVSGSEGTRTQRQYQAAGSASLNRAGHTLRAGADYRRLSPRRRDAGGSASIIADSLASLLSGENLWTASTGPQQGSAVLEELSLFAQDTWQASPRFTAIYGLRWEYSAVPDARRQAFYLDPSLGYVVTWTRPIWYPGYRNFAPRLGLAFRPTARGGTVVRAGAGVYYDSSLSIATDLLNGGPFNLSQYTNAVNAPFATLLMYGFLPDLRLPAIKQWNASVEHALGGRDALSLGYAGSAGGRLIRREMGSEGSTPSSLLALTTNHGWSRYDALQAQYRRTLAHGLRGLVSYTWSHSIDNSSSDSGLYWTASGASRAGDRASSDFDVRHVFNAALTREFRGWTLNGILRARSGFPITVLEADNYIGLAFANVFRPDLVSGRPLWIADPASPGGRRLNPVAFVAAPAATQGNLGRNAIAGFGMSQLDLAFEREFRLREGPWLRLRLEGFNVLNQANFADPVRTLNSPLFGQSVSGLNLMLGNGTPASGLAPMFQAGGARSLQVTLRLRF